MDLDVGLEAAACGDCIRCSFTIMNTHCQRRTNQLKQKQIVTNPHCVAIPLVATLKNIYTFAEYKILKKYETRGWRRTVRGEHRRAEGRETGGDAGRRLRGAGVRDRRLPAAPTAAGGVRLRRAIVEANPRAELFGECPPGPRRRQPLGAGAGAE